MNKELEALKEARKFRHEKEDHLVLIDIDYFNRCLDGIENALKDYENTKLRLDDTQTLLESPQLTQR